MLDLAPIKRLIAEAGEALAAEAPELIENLVEEIERLRRADLWNHSACACGPNRYEIHHNGKVGCATCNKWD